MFLLYICAFLSELNCITFFQKWKISCIKKSLITLKTNQITGLQRQECQAATWQILRLWRGVTWRWIHFSRFSLRLSLCWPRLYYWAENEKNLRGWCSNVCDSAWNGPYGFSFLQLYFLNVQLRVQWNGSRVAFSSFPDQDNHALSVFCCYF